MNNSPERVRVPRDSRIGMATLLLVLALQFVCGTARAAVTQLDPANAHFCAVVSYGSTGLEGVSFNVVDNGDPNPALITLNSASDAAALSGVAAIQVVLPDAVPVAKVQFLVNGVLSAETVTPPFAFTWNTALLSPGDYDVTVKATDTAGIELASDPVTVALSATDPPPEPTVDTVAPVVTLASPSAGSTLSGTVTVSAAASDNVGVTRVDFYLNDVLQASASSAPYLFNWQTPQFANGSYTLKAKAYDAAGNLGQSIPVGVAVFNDTQAPSASVSSPAAGSILSGTVAVGMAASDNVGVTRVELYLNGLLQVTLAAAPYNFTWDTSLVDNGSYTLVVKAYDAAGNAGQSAQRQVQVLNDGVAPALTINPVTSPTTATTLSLSGLVQDNDLVASVTVQVGAGAPVAAAISGTTWRLQLSGLSPGTNQITVRATDRAGNRSTASVAVQVLEPAQVPFTLAEAQLALEFAAGDSTPTAEQLSRLDVAPFVDGQSRPNGIIDFGDVVVILLKLVGRL